MIRFAICNFDGLVIGVGDFQSRNDAELSCHGFGWVFEIPSDADVQPGKHYIKDNQILVPQPVPAPSISGSGHILEWDSPPVGLHAKVYDPYISPPHLIADTALTGPDCALHLVQGGETYIVELTADFPFQPVTLEVNT